MSVSNRRLDEADEFAEEIAGYAGDLAMEDSAARASATATIAGALAYQRAMYSLEDASYEDIATWVQQVLAAAGLLTTEGVEGDGPRTLHRLAGDGELKRAADYLSGEFEPVTEAEAAAIMRHGLTRTDPPGHP